MNADGAVNKYKARLVAQSNHQHASTFLTFLVILRLLVPSIFYSELLHQKIWKFQLSRDRFLIVPYERKNLS